MNESTKILLRVAGQLAIPWTGEHNPKFSEESRKGFAGGISLAMNILFEEVSRLEGEAVAIQLFQDIEAKYLASRPKNSASGS